MYQLLRQVSSPCASKLSEPFLAFGTIVSFSLFKAVFRGTLKAVGYRGAITLEPMNWDYMDMGIRGFLTLAYEKARKLEQMIL